MNVVPRGIRHEDRAMSVPTNVGQTFTELSPGVTGPGFQPGTSCAEAQALYQCSPCLHSARSRKEIKEQEFADKEVGETQHG